MKPGDAVEYKDRELRLRLATVEKVGWKWVHVRTAGYQDRKKLLREDVLRVLPVKRRRTK